MRRSSTAEELVSTGPTAKRVVSGACVEDVIAGAAVDRFVGVPGRDEIAPWTTEELIVGLGTEVMLATIVDHIGPEAPV